MTEENKTRYSVSLTISTYDAANDRFVDTLAGDYEITKTNEGVTGEGNDDWIRVEVEPGSPDYANPKIIVSAHLRSAGENQQSVNFTRPSAN
jgi:hypothetical protein